MSFSVLFLLHCKFILPTKNVHFSVVRKSSCVFNHRPLHPENTAHLSTKPHVNCSWGDHVMHCGHHGDSLPCFQRQSTGMRQKVKKNDFLWKETSFIGWYLRVSQMCSFTVLACWRINRHPNVYHPRTKIQSWTRHTNNCWASQAAFIALWNLNYWNDKTKWHCILHSELKILVEPSAITSHKNKQQKHERKKKPRYNPFKTFLMLQILGLLICLPVKMQQIPAKSFDILLWEKSATRTI